MGRGVIYIARIDNELVPENHFKVGLSGYAEPEERMKSLSQDTMNYLGKVVCKGYVLVDDVEDCEKILHNLLAARRIDNNREFFDTPIYEIVNTIRENIANKIIEDWLEDSRGKYSGKEYYDIPEFYHLPRMNFTELITDLSNLDFQKVARFIYSNHFCVNLACTTCGMLETLKSLYLLANVRTLQNIEYRNIDEIPTPSWRSYPIQDSRITKQEAINLTVEIEKMSMKRYLEIDGANSRVDRLLMILGVVLLVISKYDDCQRRCTESLIPKFKDYFYLASPETKIRLDSVSMISPGTLDEIIEPMGFEHARKLEEQTMENI